LEAQLVAEVDEVTPFRSTTLQQIFQEFERNIRELIAVKSPQMSDDSDILEAWNQSLVLRADLQGARELGKTCRSQAKWIGFKRSVCFHHLGLLLSILLQYQ
jgi:hypothetical protein